MSQARERSGGNVSAMRRAMLTVLLAAISASGCSADAVSEPAPSYDTKGAFVAVVSDAGELELYRVLAALGQQFFDPLFVTQYDVTPRSFAEAAELAKDPSLRHGPPVTIARKYFTSHESQVVWYRSVSAEEEADFR